jgi:hypothetical protein
MTVEIGDGTEPQRIQGPQWTDSDTFDNEVLPEFVAMFREPAGVTTFKDILQLWVSKVHSRQNSKRLFEVWASEVRAGRRDPKTGRKELDNEGPWALEDEGEMLEESQWFPELFGVLSVLESPSSPLLTNESPEHTRNDRDEQVENFDNQEGRQSLVDSASKSPTDETPHMGRIYHYCNHIIVFCLGE